MASRFQGRVFLITGASSGIGRALAVEVARGGAAVVLAARNRDELAAAAREVEVAGGRAAVAGGDVAKSDDVARMVEQAVAAFGGLDVLVNNAGYGLTSFLEEVPRDELEHLFAVNVFAPVEASRLALPHLRARGGIVVNVGSVVGRRGVPAIGAYCMTKFALAGFSESQRAELARHGVHVLHVEPGMTATRFSENRVVLGPHPRTYRSSFVMPAEVAARRIARAIERRRDRLVLGLPGRVMILANALAPWLVNRVLARAVTRQYGETDLTSRPPS